MSDGSQNPAEPDRSTSVVKPDGSPADLGMLYAGPQSLAELAEECGDENHARWLAAAALKLNGWPMKLIGRAFGVSESTVSRRLRSTVHELASEHGGDNDLVDELLQKNKG